ncbi:hypothetical protein ACIQYW_18780 [Rhodococcus erythropolis]|uniref:hypothetical protein n=1 Tax=Actinomycetes TaxID=1760 RepID=UPI00332146C4
MRTNGTPTGYSEWRTLFEYDINLAIDEGEVNSCSPFGQWHDDALAAIITATPSDRPAAIAAAWTQFHAEHPQGA